MGKQSFKLLVKESCDIASFKNLSAEKDKLSKGKDIKYVTFQTQPYLMSDSGLSVETMRKIYHIKCRELPVKANFPSAFENNFCLFPYCTNEDSQYHIFSSNCFISDSINEITDTSVKYSDIFSDIQRY